MLLPRRHDDVPLPYFFGNQTTLKPADQDLSTFLLSSLLSMMFRTLLPMNVESSVTHQFAHVFTKNIKTFNDIVIRLRLPFPIPQNVHSPLIWIRQVVQELMSCET